MSFSATVRLRLARFQLRLQDPEIRRAFRATAAYMTPVLACHLSGIGQALDASFAALCAHNISLTAMRGPYKQRFFLLLAMSTVLTGAAGLGALVSGSALASVVGMGLLAVFSACWRHLSPDYGPNLATGSMLVFLIALALPHAPWMLEENQTEVSMRMLYALGGALTGTFYQMLFWPIRPQHPLRQTVADGWNKLAELCETMIPEKSADGTAAPQTLAQAEAELHEILDKNVFTLDSEGKKRADFLKKLDAMNLGCVRLTTQVVAFHAAFEPILRSPVAARITPVAGSFYVALGNLARSTATTLVTRRAEHFGLTWLRLQRVTNLARVLRERLLSEPELDAEDVRQTVAMLQALETTPERLEQDLRATVEGLDDRRLLPRLPDVGIHSLKPLTAGLNFSWPPDPILLRYVFRVAVLTMLAVAVYKHFDISHGYWIALTMMVVLQPNYGPTREKAMQRMIGTTAGGVAASIFAWVHPPLGVVLALMAVSAFGFAANLKRRYTVAVFFVTIMVVLSTETMATVSLEVTESRILCTVAGGVSAMLAALAFWPNWERRRFPSILIKTMVANRDYLLLLASRLSSGGGLDEGINQARHRAEAAGSELFASLQRVSGDPRSQQGDFATFLSLMSSTLRVTRALTVLSFHLRPDLPWSTPALDPAIRKLTREINALAHAIKTGDTQGDTDEQTKAALRALDTAACAPDAPPHAPLAYTQLEKLLAELETSWVALRGGAKLEQSNEGPFVR